MPILLALLSGVSFGAGDFLGGIATRREGSAPAVVVAAHILSLGFLALAVWWFPRDAAPADYLWGALAGLAGAVGLMLLYRGLAIGTMSIVAPITAVGAAVVPVMYGLSTGDAPDPLSLAGALVALVGVWLVSVGEAGGGGARRMHAGLGEAIASGIAFGLFFILISNTSEDTGMIPLVAARLASICVLGGIVLALRGTLRLQRHTILPMAGAGVLDITANALFLVAARAGNLPIAAVLSSLYPATTVLLAWGFLREPIAGRRGVGLIIVGAGVALIAAGGA
jgi:drug/metabolite transporter (DMT)-like permease